MSIRDAVAMPESPCAVKSALVALNARAFNRQRGAKPSPVARGKAVKADRAWRGTRSAQTSAARAEDRGGNRAQVAWLRALTAWGMCPRLRHRIAVAIAQ